MYRCVGCLVQRKYALTQSKIFVYLFVATGRHLIQFIRVQIPFVNARDEYYYNCIEFKLASEHALVFSHSHVDMIYESLNF